MRALVLALAIAAALPTLARADGVMAICADNGATEAVCACAARGIAGELGIDEYAQYHRIGWDYALLRERGASAADAWDSALAAETARSGETAAVVRHRADGIARGHRAHIRWCRSG